MIRDFKHKGLEDLFVNNSRKGVNPDQCAKLLRILTYLNMVKVIKDMNVPGYRLHPLKGTLEGYWSITVTGNYRIIFKFDEIKQEIYDVDYIDYH